MAGIVLILTRSARIANYGVGRRRESSNTAIVTRRQTCTGGCSAGRARITRHKTRCVGIPSGLARRARSGVVERSCWTGAAGAITRSVGARRQWITTTVGGGTLVNICLTHQSGKPLCAVARIRIDAIHTGSAVETRCACALVDVGLAVSTAVTVVTHTHVTSNGIVAPAVDTRQRRAFVNIGLTLQPAESYRAKAHHSAHQILTCSAVGARVTRALELIVRTIGTVESERTGQTDALTDRRLVRIDGTMRAIGLTGLVVDSVDQTVVADCFCGQRLEFSNGTGRAV